MLERGQEQANPDPRAERGRENPPEHVQPPSVAGEADRVPRIVRGLVDRLGLREAGYPDEYDPEEDGGDAIAQLLAASSWRSVLI